jgi:hypothetical protein
MTQWHADIDQPELAEGTRLTVLSDHQVVRVVTADTLSIAAPSGDRVSAVVLDRTEGNIRLVFGDGRSASLGILVDESLHRPGDIRDAFSWQVWKAR